MRRDMNIIKVASIWAVFGGFFAGGASAQPLTGVSSDLSYDYASVKIVSETLEDYDCTQKGIVLEGSYLVDKDIFVIGGYSDVSGGGCGSSTMSVGAGYKFAFNSVFDAYGSLSMASTSVDEGQSDSGLVLEGGVRGFIASGLETRFGVSHHTAFDGNTSLIVGAAYRFQDTLSLTADISLGSEASEVAVGLRKSF